MRLASALRLSLIVYLQSGNGKGGLSKSLRPETPVFSPLKRQKSLRRPETLPALLVP